MNDFLKMYGAILISSATGIILVLMGILADQQGLLNAGMIPLGGSLGLHLGARTSLVQVPDAPVASVTDVVDARKP